MDIPTLPNRKYSHFSDHDLEEQLRITLQSLPLDPPKDCQKLNREISALLAERIFRSSKENSPMKKLCRSSKENQNLPKKCFNSRPVLRELTCSNSPSSTGPSSGIRNGQLEKRRGTTSRRKGEGIIRDRQGVGGGESSEQVMQLIASQHEKLEKRERERQLKETGDRLHHSRAQLETTKKRKEMEDAARVTQASRQKGDKIQTNIVDCQITSQIRSKLEWERLLKKKEDLLEQTLKAQEVMKKEMEDAVREIQALKQNLKEKDQRMECIVCLDEFGDDRSKQRAHYKDCNHANICFGCATTLWKRGNRRCPSCNTTMTGMPLRLPAKIFL